MGGGIGGGKKRRERKKNEKRRKRKKRETAIKVFAGRHSKTSCVRKQLKYD